MDTIAQFQHYLKSLRTNEEPLDFGLDMFMRIPEMAGKVIYAFDYHAGKMLFASGFDKTLGYPPKTVINSAFIIGFVHPDDQPIVANLSEKALAYSIRAFTAGEKPWEGHLSLDYRVRKYGGSYIRVLRESVVLALAADGSPTATLSVMTDIEHIKSSGSIAVKMFGPNAELIPVHSILSTHQSTNGILSQRETQVLQHIGLGMQSTEIANVLSISKHTVDNHRKNMLRKTGLNNTAELVKFGLENGLL